MELSEGMSYIIWDITSSSTARRPLAPIPRSMDLSATASRAPGVKTSFTISYSSSFWYCLTRAFLGSVRIFTKSSRLSGDREVITGRRPTSSGIMPNFSRSWG